MSTLKLFVDKELSWLSFNERVLQEAQDPNVPLVERVRFLGIYSNNLDEFYKVRFANIQRRILLHQRKDKRQHYCVLLEKMQSKVHELNHRFESIYNKLVIQLARNDIYLVNESQLSVEQQSWVKQFFQQRILAHLTPLWINKNCDLLTSLKDEQSYLVVEAKQNKTSRYSLLEIPSQVLPRFILVPQQPDRPRKTLILLDNIIRLCLDDIYQNVIEYNSLNCFAIKMTRDAAYELSGEAERNLIELMSESLNQRLTALPVRFIYQRDMPKELLDILQKKLEMSSFDSLIPSGRYHNYKDLAQFPNLGPTYLEYQALPPLHHPQFEGYPTPFAAIRANDILLYYPYHTFAHLTELIRLSSFDPAVTQIKISIYRVAKDSRLMHSLMEATRNGKLVTVVVELQARFDEQTNIEWAQTLNHAGVRVVFGAPGLKIHSKLLLIVREEQQSSQCYAYIGTGNFHEWTAAKYTDFGLITADPVITKDVNKVFKYIEKPYQSVSFSQLIVSPKNSRKRFYQLIDFEMAQALRGEKAELILKLNNLADRKLIKKLYDASSVGVKIHLIIRGMCSLIPGIKDISDTITVTSIVDRYLEHPRVIIAYNQGDPKVFISSADWMRRNMDHRIEVTAPILCKQLKKTIIDIIDLQQKDTVKARVIDEKMSNHYVTTNRPKKLRSQIAIYDYLKRQQLAPYPNTGDAPYED
jgi:polyphosphate kinase